MGVFRSKSPFSLPQAGAYFQNSFLKHYPAPYASIVDEPQLPWYMSDFGIN
jgi:hypothetical protein